MDGFQPEGIAIGGGPTAYAGSLADGDLVRADLRTGAVERFVDVEERMAVGLGLDPSGGLVYVSGGLSGQAWVYDTTTGAEVAVELHRVDPASGATTAVDLDGFALTAGDGLLLNGRRDLTVVRNQENTITSIALSPDLATGTVTGQVTDPDFDVPTTVAAHGSRQYVVNARFGIPDPGNASYTLVRVGD